MTDLNIGQLAASTMRARNKVFKDNVTDNMPVMKAMKENGGIRYQDGGYEILDELTYAQNTNVAWVTGTGSVPLADPQIADAARFDWKFQLAALTYSLAEQGKNSGKEKSIDLLKTKISVMEASAKNIFHAGILSDGTGSAGLQLGGLALLVKEDPTTGTVGSIDLSTAAGTFFRNYAMNTASSADWTDFSNAPLDVTNVEAAYDIVINKTQRNEDSVNLALAGTTHFQALTRALRGYVQVQNETEAGKKGYSYLWHRGLKVYHVGGVNFSGQSTLSATKTYFINTSKNYLNLVFHPKFEFEVLDPVYSNDQAVFSRLMFTMCTMTRGIGKCHGVVFT